MLLLNFYGWRQLPPTKDEKLKHWQLYNKETGMVVVDIKLSKYADPKYDVWIRKKIQSAYEKYDDKVWFTSLRVF